MIDKDLMTQEQSPRRLLVTGGAGFIGSNFIHYWLQHYPQDEIYNLDALTYAGNLENLADIADLSNYHFIKGDICNAQLVDEIMAGTNLVVHFAAESHVDRSISEPDQFLQTNIIGTHNLLQASLKHRVTRFHHISTDEVFGSLELGSAAKFTEQTNYHPNSPYSASKASSDHLVRAYGETYGLNYSISNCSNNYGPYQFPEKFVSLAITNLIDDQPVPVYGSGENIRDWLYVTDHCAAIDQVIHQAGDQQTYLVGGLTKDVNNLELLKIIANLMHKPDSMFEFVTDRPGHDLRYAVDWQKINQELGWSPQVTLEEGLQATITWYQEHQTWWRQLKEKNQEYFKKQYQQPVTNKE